MDVGLACLDNAWTFAVAWVARGHPIVKAVRHSGRLAKIACLEPGKGPAAPNSPAAWALAPPGELPGDRDLDSSRPGAGRCPPNCSGHWTEVAVSDQKWPLCSRGPHNAQCAHDNPSGFARMGRAESVP